MRIGKPAIFINFAVMNSPRLTYYWRAFIKMIKFSAKIKTDEY